MKKVILFLLVSLFVFTSCKKDTSNPVVADTIPAVPILSTPTDTSSNIAVPVVLTWKESSGAKSYTLQVSASSSFSSFVFNKSDINTTTQQVPDLNYLAVYYWRVSATNSAGTSDWSKVWSFTTTGEAAFVPQLSLPANGAVDQKLSPILVWGNVLNANLYTLQISTNSSFTSFVFDEDSLTTTSKQINDLSGSTKYYWRVSARNNFGTKGWSETWSFTTGAAPVPPVLLSPSDGATDILLSPTLSWNASSGATNYTLQVSANSSFSSFVYNQSSTTTSKQITGLTNSTKYYWRVSTTNNFGTSNPSVVWSFTTGPLPSPPILTSPTDGATNISLSPTITWNTSSGATTYTLQVSLNSSFSSFVFNSSDLTITNQQLTELKNFTKYYWRVMAKNKFGNSPWSESWSFNSVSACASTTTVFYGGKTYHTVAIGSQCWLKENLDIGTMIQSGIDPSNNGVIEKYCYNNDPNNCVTLGGLYRWDEAMEYSKSSGTKGICPMGWHLPTRATFDTLHLYSYGSNPLKEIGQGIGSGAGTNSTGFSALMAGGHFSAVGFINLNEDAFFWSSTEYIANDAFNLHLVYNNNNFGIGLDGKQFSYSVRCLKDD